MRHPAFSYKGKLAVTYVQVVRQCGKGEGVPSLKETFIDHFLEIWGELFTSPVHLDSALSKRAAKTKNHLAQIVPPILLRPVSLAEALGVGLAPGAPWNLTSTQLEMWSGARLLASAVFDQLVNERPKPLPEAQPVPEDFPPSMVEEWKNTWGDEVTTMLIRALGTEASLSIRAYRSIDRETLFSKLRERDLVPKQSEFSAISPTGIRLSRYSPILQTPEFEAGGFEIQDEGSQIMAYFALWPEQYGSLLGSVPSPVALPTQVSPLPARPPILTVVDACAGAGGKTLALADALAGKGRVYAYDTSPRKLQALRRRTARTGLTNIQAVEVVEGQEQETTSRFRESADVVLVDAPCSGWGVLRRNPDIKWRQDARELERLEKLQLRLLKAYSELVKPGGRLVYGVCTFRKAETRDIVEKFLEKTPGFEAGVGGYLGPSPSDGFFMQSLQRR